MELSKLLTTIRKLFANFDFKQNYLTFFLRKRLFRIFFGLTILTLAIFSIPILFSKYNPTFSYTLQHSFFILGILTSAFLLITDKMVNSFQSLYSSIELGIFDRLQYTLAKIAMLSFNKLQNLEINIDKLQYTLAKIAMLSFNKLQNLEINIDKLQYTIAKKVNLFANTLRKSQTGDLNLNMLAVLIGFIVIFSITILISL